VSVTSTFEVQVWNDEQWEFFRRESTKEAAEAVALESIDSRTKHARVIEVRTEVKRIIAASMTYMGTSDEEVVQALRERRGM